MTREKLEVGHGRDSERANDVGPNAARCVLPASISGRSPADLLIADLPTDGRLTELRSERRILRLGEGVDQTKQLSVAAMDRVIQCLRSGGSLSMPLMSMLRRSLRRAPCVMQRTVMSFSIA